MEIWKKKMCLDNLHVQISFRKPAAGMVLGGEEDQRWGSQEKACGEKEQSRFG